MRFTIYNFGPKIRVGLIPVKEDDVATGEFTAIFRTRFTSFKNKVVVLTLEKHIVHIGRDITKDQLDKVIQTSFVVKKPFQQFSIDAELPEGYELTFLKDNLYYFAHKKDLIPFDAFKVGKIPVISASDMKDHRESVTVVESADLLLSTLNEALEVERTNPISEEEVNLDIPNDTILQDLKADVGFNLTDF